MLLSFFLPPCLYTPGNDTRPSAVDNDNVPTAIAQHRITKKSRRTTLADVPLLHMVRVNRPLRATLMTKALASAWHAARKSRPRHLAFVKMCHVPLQFLITCSFAGRELFRLRLLLRCSCWFCPSDSNQGKWLGAEIEPVAGTLMVPSLSLDTRFPYSLECSIRRTTDTNLRSLSHLLLQSVGVLYHIITEVGLLTFRGHETSRSAPRLPICS